MDVALYATLRKYRPDGEKRGTFRMQVADGATVLLETGGQLDVGRVPTSVIKVMDTF